MNNKAYLVPLMRNGRANFYNHCNSFHRLFSPISVVEGITFMNEAFKDNVKDNFGF